MIAKESLPTLRRWFSPLDHILGHTRLPDFDAELEQLSMDPRRSPQRISNAHLVDKLAYVRGYSWSAATTSPGISNGNPSSSNRRSAVGWGDRRCGKKRDALRVDVKFRIQ